MSLRDLREEKMRELSLSVEEFLSAGIAFGVCVCDAPMGINKEMKKLLSSVPKSYPLIGWIGFSVQDVAFALREGKLSMSWHPLGDSSREKLLFNLMELMFNNGFEIEHSDNPNRRLVIDLGV